MVLLNKENTVKPYSGSSKPEGSSYRDDRSSDHTRRKRRQPDFQGYGKTFLELNAQHHIRYIELLKEERIWRSQGQYWLAQEASRKATCLLNGEVEDASNQSGDHLFVKTKKF